MEYDSRIYRVKDTGYSIVRRLFYNVKLLQPCSLGQLYCFYDLNIFYILLILTIPLPRVPFSSHELFCLSIWYFSLPLRLLFYFLSSSVLFMTLSLFITNITRVTIWLVSNHFLVTQTTILEVFDFIFLFFIKIFSCLVSYWHVNKVLYTVCIHVMVFFLSYLMFVAYVIVTTS